MLIKMSVQQQNTVKTADEGSHSIEVWKTAIENMSFNEIALLEYSTKNNPTFRKMFPCTQSTYMKSSRCSLCETASLTNFTALLQHIQGKKHVTKVKAVVEDYKHPTIDPFKNQDSVVKIEKVDSSDNEMETQSGKSGQSKIVINPASISAELLKQSSESTRDVIADKKILREQMPKMTVSDLSLVEYRFINTDWQKLFEKSNNYMVCTMCKSSPLPHLSAMRQHLNERKHQTNADLTKGLYHPKYAPIKDESSMKEINKPDNSENANSNQKDNKNSETSADSNPEENISEPVDNKRNLPSNTKQGKTDTPTTPSSSQQSQLVVTSKQKSLTNMFRTKMLALNIEDLKKIEYRYSTGPWKKMLTQNNSNQIKCVLCNLIIIQSLGDIKQHIAGKKHQLVLDSIALLYHPTLANTKTEEQEISKNSSKETGFDDQHFREEMPTLPLADLKQVEYTSDNEIWKNLISVINGTFKCTLCNASNISSAHTLSDHLKGKRHTENMSSVKKFYHPTKTLKKDVQNVNQSDAQNISTPTECKSTTKSVTSESQSETTTKSDTTPNSEFKTSTAKLETKSETAVVTTKVTSEPVTNSTKKSKSSDTSPETLKTQSEVTSKTSEVLSDTSTCPTRSGEKSKDPCSRKSDLKNSSPFKSPAENVSKREGRIVCTIELEDSPEREIEIEKDKDEDEDNEKSISVINPAAVKLRAASELNAIESTHRPKSNEQNLQRPSVSHTQSQSQVKILTPTKHKSNNEQLKTSASTSQSASDMEKSRENQKKDKEITPRLNRNNPSHTSEKNKTSFSTKIFSSKIERDVEGLIGVEYVVKILRNVNDSSPRYECCLCEVEVDGVGMQWHLKGLHHRMKFLERHFPTAMRSFSQYKDNVNMSAVMAQIADKLSVAIEKYHGRDLPYECLYDEFRSNRHGIMSKVFSFKHASELGGPSFTDIINKRTIDEFIANRTSYKNPQPDPKRRTTFDNDNHFNKRQRLESPKLDVEEHRKLVEQFLENTNRSGNSYRRSTPRKRRSRSPHRYTHQRRSRSRSPRRRSRSRSRDYRRYTRRIHNSPTRNGDIWQTYCRQFDRALEELEKQYERYRKDPESHPRYDEEWRQFWSRRTDELIAEGRNASAHNFQPEWVRFFIHRVNELYEEAVEDIRMNLRKKLGLGLHNNELSDDRYHVGIDRSYRQNEDIMSHQHPVNEPFDHMRENQQQINMKPPQMQRIQYMQQTQQMQQMYQMPPYPMQQSHNRMQEQQLQNETHFPEIEETQTTLPPVKQHRPQPEIRNRVERKSQSHADIEFDTEVITPVSVLRILTALEDHLGSLGPKVIDLLSKALTLEKVKPNTAAETLLNVENCVFLETVCEKLKGQLLAGLAEPLKIRAVKKAIKDVTTLLNSVSEKLQNQPLEPPKPPVISVVESTKPVSNTEKKELASKLANALSAQGKTDFTTEQLEQLVTVYSMINKKAKETNTTASQRDNERQRQQPQKSLSDTLADLMKSGDDKGNEQFKRNPTTFQNIFPSRTASYANPRDNRASTSDNRSQTLTKPYDFGMLSSFDTSLKINQPAPSSNLQNFDGNPGRNLSTDMLSKILLNANQNSENSTQNPGHFNANRGNFERNNRFMATANNSEHQFYSKNSETNQVRNQQQSTFTNNYSIQNRSNIGGPMISYPSNIQMNQQGRQGFRNPQNNSSRQAPMGWGEKFGYKR